MIEPTIGYLLGSYALRQYIDISLHPTITSEDPRWIGAWWLGEFYCSIEYY
jgi:Organic Anion Transporter Polypeptide (OATP) family.